ncbi:hypothetical protein B0H14DRAFT_2596891 [Mycena olivaceomarginata]|nr:hypothetical protein B0H14DRAFT_2596891 [Mycena olivaceomarginata]
MHEELLELVQTFSDASTISDTSLVYSGGNELNSVKPATNSIELAALIGLHLGLNPRQDLTKPVVQHLLRQSLCLLILDNLETVWKPMESRAGTEELLSLLTEIEQLAVVITMWGDDSYDSKYIQQLLLFPDNMPLAVNLIAHVVDFEGLSTVLAQWQADKTALLSAGHDRKSNLDTSISLSVWSPRVTPGSKELFSLLSILLDGILDLELV